MNIATKSEDPLREPTLFAWGRIVDPFLDLVFDSGLTVQEITKLLRERSIHAAARIVMTESGRVNNSRVAIMTGLPRSEVARVLQIKNFSPSMPPRSLALKVLAAWFGTAEFQGIDGKPAVLPIFGKRGSFEQLVRTNGGGIPVRAMLDQLLQIDAIEVLTSQRVKPRPRTRVFAGPGASIENLGEKAGNLIDTLKRNLKRPLKPYFEHTMLLDKVDLHLMPLVRQEIANRGVKFIKRTHAFFSNSFAQSTRNAGSAKRTRRVGLTLFYFENEQSTEEKPPAHTVKAQRKNLKRMIKL